MRGTVPAVVLVALAFALACGSEDDAPPAVAIVDYVRLLAESPDWRVAFRRAFEMSVEEAYAAFEAYRAEVVPVRRRVTGSVSLADGGSVKGWPIGIWIRRPSPSVARMSQG